ncbi:hypothetical protein SRABI128_06537 [Microbacterium sp. Bi128]|nr:hypothetical protein SRABI128_06537 [Microbacterium sp. Bi128]
MPGGPGGLGGAGDVVGGQAREVGGVIQQQGSGLHALLDALPELGAEPGKLGVDVPEALLAGVVELDAGGPELLEVFLDEPGGLRVQDRCVQRREALVEPAVEVDGVLVGGEERGQAGLEVADGVRGVCGHQREEGRGGPVQEPAGAFHGEGRVFEGRGRRGVHDGLDFGKVLGQAGLDGLGVVRVVDIRKRRQSIGQGAGAQEGIGHEMTLSCRRPLLNDRLRVL